MTIHALERAQQRYGLSLGFSDLKEIIALVQMGFGKEIFYPKNIYGTKDKGKRYFHLRYQGKLIEPVIADLHTEEPKIVTFQPTGKGKSWKKTCYDKIDKDFIGKVRRLNGR